jgi:phenylacetate-CoA ligase
MNAKVVRKMLLPAHEALLRRSTFRCLRELEISQWLPGEEIRELQIRKLRNLLTHAFLNVPYYRQYFPNLEMLHDDPSDIAILKRIPTLTKDLIREHLDNLTWNHAPGGLFRYTTGGSTGSPLIFYFDRRRQAYDQAARMRAHRWFGVDVGEREVYLWGSPIEMKRQDRLRAWRDRWTNHLLLNAFAMSGKDMDQYLEEIEKYQPTALYGYPSSIALLVRHAIAHGRRLQLKELKAVFSTGESLDPTHKKLIESYFEVPVANGYGSREGGFIGHECPAGRIHLTDENVICEILGKDGNPSVAEDLGEIVVTHLDAYAMPFIRYRTGDVGRLSHGPCACGRGLSTLEIVAGRKTDFVIATDGTIKHGLSLIYIMREMPGLREFRIVQQMNLDIDLLLVEADPMNRSQENRIRRQVGDQIGRGAQVRLHRVAHIPPDASGKYRHVISEAAQARLASF